jgi:RNA polymerase sigma-70 factor (sigma-E family)
MGTNMSTAVEPGPYQSGTGVGGTMREDTEAFDAFVRARLPHLLRFGRALTGDEHAAADLVQDALERTLMRWSKVTSDDPEGYVRRAMVNRSISVWRKVRRERLTDDVPQQSYDDPRRDDALLAALRRLPPRQRAVIALRYYEDLTEAQTAAILGCAVGTVKSQSSLAMARLRSLLDDTKKDLS